MLRFFREFSSHFLCFLPAKFPHSTKPAPLFWDLSGRTGRNRPLPRSLLHSLTSTPKPRAEGSSPSAPAKKERQASACLSFFVVTGGEASARGACRASPPKRRLWRMQRGGDGAAVGDWQGGPAAADRAGYRKRACEASSSPSFHFRHVMEDLPSLPLIYSSLSHPPSSVLTRPQPLQHPKRTRVRLFLAESGAFFSFSLFSCRKIFALVFVHLAA